VALDDQGNPVEVPALIPETDEQRLRVQAGKARQAYRLEQARKFPARNNP